MNNRAGKKTQDMTSTYKAKCMVVLSQHIGKEKAIDMGELYEVVFGESYDHKINGTRDLRRIVTLLRREGAPICSESSKSCGGYYLAGAASELTNYLERLRKRAFSALVLESKIRNIGMLELLGQMWLDFGGNVDASI